MSLVARMCWLGHRGYRMTSSYAAILELRRHPRATPPSSSYAILELRHPRATPSSSSTRPRFAALRQLGFREGEVQSVLAELRGDASLRDAPTEHLLPEALRSLCSSA